MTRIRFDGCDLSPERGTPVRARLAGAHQWLIGCDHAWDELLDGEELAHLAVEPRARRPLASRCPTSSTRACATALGALTALYAHQAEAWEAPAPRRALVVTTGTASGKTLAFNLPVLDALAREPKSRALYLYPTKALAQDQARALGASAQARPAGDLRRRHGGRAALADPQVGERDPHQPGHAPRGRAAAPRPLGRRAREPPLRRRRRGARLPRRLRLARRRTSCGGCGGSPASTAPTRSSCSPRRRSRTPASSARVAARRAGAR